eukprot:507227-Pelagomonas_calceolata.AAC.1
MSGYSKEILKGILLLRLNTGTISRQDHPHDVESKMPILTPYFIEVGHKFIVDNPTKNDDSVSSFVQALALTLASMVPTGSLCPTVQTSVSTAHINNMCTQALYQQTRHYETFSRKQNDLVSSRAH